MMENETKKEGRVEKKISMVVKMLVIIGRKGGENVYIYESYFVEELIKVSTRLHNLIMIIRYDEGGQKILVDTV